jgi:hypothetical protein
MYNRQLAPPLGTTGVPDIFNSTFRAAILRMRLRIEEGATHPLEYITTHATDDVVYVFVVQKGQAIVLEDAPGMFPSDELVTRLRLLMD